MNFLETKQYVHSRDFFKCQYPNCTVKGYDNLFLAHRIPKGETEFVIDYMFRAWKETISKKQALKILHHQDNLVSVCINQDHNQYFCIGASIKKREKLIDTIWTKIELGEDNV